MGKYYYPHDYTMLPLKKTSKKKLLWENTNNIMLKIEDRGEAA